MTDHLIRNNLRKKELVVIESKQKLPSFVLPHPPFHFPAFNVIVFKKSVYELQYWVSKCFCNAQNICVRLMCHIQLKIVTIMHVCIVAQVLLIS